VVIQGCCILEAFLPSTCDFQVGYGCQLLAGGRGGHRTAHEGGFKGPGLGSCECHIYLHSPGVELGYCITHNGKRRWEMASSEVPKKRKQVLLKSHQSFKYPLCFVVRIAWAMQRAHHDDNTHRYWVSVKFPSLPAHSK